MFGSKFGSFVTIGCRSNGEVGKLRFLRFGEGEWGMGRREDEGDGELQAEGLVKIISLIKPV